MKMVDKLEELSKNPKYVSLYDEEKLNKAAFSLRVHKEIEEATIEMVKKMLEEKLDIEMISKITGLSEKEIKSLKD